MKAMKDAGILVLIAVAALAVRIGPVDAPAPTQDSALAELVAPAAIAAPADDSSLLLVDIEDLELDAATNAQLPAAPVLENLEVDLSDADLESVALQVGELVQAMVVGAASGQAEEMLSRAVAAVEAAAPKPPCARAG